MTERRLIKREDLDLTSIVDPNAHASRHAFGGADAIGSDALRFAQIGKVLGAGTSVSVPAGGTSLVPSGVHIVFLGANTRVEAYDNVSATWKTIIPAGGSGLVISDGTNVRLVNAGTVAESSNIRSFA